MGFLCLPSFITILQEDRMCCLYHRDHNIYFCRITTKRHHRSISCQEHIHATQLQNISSREPKNSWRSQFPVSTPQRRSLANTSADPTSSFQGPSHSNKYNLHYKNFAWPRELLKTKWHLLFKFRNDTIPYQSKRYFCYRNCKLFTIIKCRLSFVTESEKANVGLPLHLWICIT
jgi:hypothetical protein